MDFVEYKHWCNAIYFYLRDFLPNRILDNDFFSRVAQRGYMTYRLFPIENNDLQSIFENENLNDFWTDCNQSYNIGAMGRRASWYDCAVKLLNKTFTIEDHNDRIPLTLGFFVVLLYKAKYEGWNNLRRQEKSCLRTIAQPLRSYLPALLGNVYDSYFKWNDALFGYYFDGHQEGSSVTLYVDDEILSQVRTAHQLDCDFVESVFLNQEKLKNFVAFFNLQNNVDLNVRDIDSLVENLLEIDREIPAYFAFIIAIIYAAQHNQGLDGGICHQNIHRFFIDQNCAVHTHRGNQSIANRFNQFTDRLSECADFDNDTLIHGQLINIGRIKYHLVLPKRAKDQLESVLIEKQLVWDEEEYSFADFVNKILWGELPNNLITIINEPLRDWNNRSYFESLIRNCRYHRVATDRIINKTLLYVYTRVNNGGNWEEYLNFKVDDPDFDCPLQYSNGLFSQRTVNENDDCCFIQGNVQWETITDLQFDNRYSFSTISRNYLLLQDKGNSVFEQARDPHLGKSYLVISRQPNPTIINGQTSRDISQFITIFGQGIFAYQVESWVCNDLADIGTINQNEGNIQNEPIRIQGGIQTPSNSKHKPYIPFALPYIELEDWSTGPDIKIKQVNNESETPPQIEKKQVANRIYIYFVDDIQGCNQYELTVTQGGFSKVISFWSSKKQVINYSNNYSYNGFGECVNEDINYPQSDIDYNVQWASPNFEESFHCKLLDILNELSDENGVVSQKHLIKALEYTLKYYGAPDNRDSRRKVIDVLKRMGYMNGYLAEGKYRNQLNKVQLVKTPRQSLYLLKGCYTSSDVRRLQDTFGNVNVKFINFTQDEINDNPEFACLPSLVLVNKPNNILPIEGIEIVDHITASDLIEHSAIWGECEEHFLNNYDDGEHNDNVHCTKNEYGDWTLFASNHHKYSYYLNDQRVQMPIPEWFRKSYCAIHNNEPMLIVKPNNANNTIDTNSIYTEIMVPKKTMALPKIIDMGLCELNFGLPTTEYVFIVNAKNQGLDVNLYNVVDTYESPLSSEVVKNIAGKISGNNLESLRSPLVYVVKNQTTNRYTLFLNEKKDSFEKVTLFLEENNQLIAFANTDLVCIKIGNSWREIIEPEMSVNEKLSSVFTNKVANLQKQDFRGEIPTKNNDAKTVKILNRIQYA